MTPDDKIVLRWIQKLAYLDSLKPYMPRHPEELITSPDLNQSRLVLPAARRSFRSKALSPFVHPIPFGAGSWLNEVEGFQYYLLDSPGYRSFKQPDADRTTIEIWDWKLSLLTELGHNEFLYCLRDVADQGYPAIGGYDSLHSKYYILFTIQEGSTNDSDSRED